MADRGRADLQQGRLPARFAPIVTALILSIVMTLVVSVVSTLRGVGLGAEFLSVWLSAWGLSWVVAFPTLLVVLPHARRWGARMCRDG